MVLDCQLLKDEEFVCIKGVFNLIQLSTITILGEFFIMPRFISIHEDQKFSAWCLFLKDVHNVDGDVLLCTRVIFNFSMVEDEVVFENMGRINETIISDMNIVISRNLSNVESVHHQCDRDVYDHMHLQAMELQVQLWKPHSKTSILLEFFSCGK
jgi:hypothetical protein